MIANYLPVFLVIMDQMIIKGLAVDAYIGVHKWEQAILQRLLIDLTMPINCANCDDKLENTIDYAAVCQMIVDFIASIQKDLLVIKEQPSIMQGGKISALIAKASAEKS